MEHDAVEAVSRLVLQLSLVLFAAKLGGELAERGLKQPAVLGELGAGLLIGPYALGAIDLPFIGPAFSLPAAERGPTLVPISAELYAIGQIAAVVLLFVSGLETDFGQFIRFGPAAGLVGTGGIILPLLFGIFATVLFGLAGSPLEPAALFMGAIMTATSVGITARVLGDLGRLDSPEGVTILGAAVIDDVLGILLLAIVVGLAASGVVSPGEIGLTGARALGLWLGLTLVSALLAGWVARIYLAFRTEGAVLGLVLAMAFLSAYLAQRFGLALIIGAYSAGLAFSRSPLSPALERPLRAVYHALVPIFFVTMGMLVDFGAMLPVLAFGSVVTLLAIVGKVAGCAAPALLVGFNRMGATRIGLGMLPRGEVALIIAGAGLTSGTITSDIFGVAVLMTIVTTVLAPVLLVPAFKRGGSGLRTATTRLPAPGAAEAGRHLFSLPDGLVTLWTKHLEAALGARGFQKLGELHDPATYSVVEYHRGERFLSVQVRPKREGRSEVVVEADAPEWQALIAAAVQEATCEAVEELAQTLAARERP
ncbi:MAG TPA: cation:proton antiporter [Chloroflexota bacterium]|nr:cation:proton antiporter [Chloroflexota bacterium]